MVNCFEVLLSNLTRPYNKRLQQEQQQLQRELEGEDPRP
jgi:hypothetical protein